MQARSTASASNQDVNENSPVRRISDSLNDALGQLAGVSVNQSGTNVDGSITISLRGMDETQTGVSVGGVRLTGASQGAALRALGTDLFSGASVDFSGNASSIAGQVNYRTLEPTKQWITRFTTSYGTYDRSSYRRRGYRRHREAEPRGAVRAPLDGLAVRRADLRRPERSRRTRTTPDSGSPASFSSCATRSTTSSRSTSGGIDSNRGSSLTCPLFVQELACGNGPHNFDSDRFRLGSFGAQAQLGNVALTVNAGAYGGRYTQDRSNGVLLGVPMPSEDIYDYDGRFGSASFNVTVRRHTLALGLDTNAGRNIYTPVHLLFSLPTVYRDHSSSVNLTDTYKISHEALAQRRPVDGDRRAARTHRCWRPSAARGNRATATRSTRTRSSAARSRPAPARDAFSEPALAAYTCNGITRLGGPGDANTKQSSASYNAAWTHNWRTGSFTASVYRQLQIGQAFYAGVPILSEPAGYVPAGYLDAIRQAWNRANSCAGVPFDPNSIYVAQSIGGTTRRYEGWSLTGRVALGRNVVVFPTLATTGATILTADPRFAGPYSFIVPGWQLPTARSTPRASPSTRCSPTRSWNGSPTRSTKARTTAAGWMRTRSSTSASPARCRAARSRRSSRT